MKELQSFHLAAYAPEGLRHKLCRWSAACRGQAMRSLTPLVQNSDIRASIRLLRLLNLLGSHNLMCAASEIRHSLQLLLCRWRVFGSLLLASMQTSVVASIVPGHHDVLHVFVLHCSSQHVINCQTPTPGSNGCQSDNLPVARIACGMASARVSAACGTGGASALGDWTCGSCCPERSGSWFW
jgi:hypothetical protein